MWVTLTILNNENLSIDDRFKIVFDSGLLSDRTMRLFAVWCAREALKTIDKPDPRSIEAINVAERYANGEATTEELAAARAVAAAATWAGAAAVDWDAAWAAAHDAAGAAAAAAARYAAWAGAWAAARDAAGAGTWDVEKKKQLEKLKETMRGETL